jgi:hypothetical protein
MNDDSDKCSDALCDGMKLVGYGDIMEYSHVSDPQPLVAGQWGRVMALVALTYGIPEVDLGCGTTHLPPEPLHHQAAVDAGCF